MNPSWLLLFLAPSLVLLLRLFLDIKFLRDTGDVFNLCTVGGYARPGIPQSED